MEVKLNKFTESLTKIKSSLDGNTVVNNKYFNYKDALFTGVVGTGAGIGYMVGEGDKKRDMAVNGAMFGIGIGAMGRYGAKRVLDGGNDSLVRSAANTALKGDHMIRKGNSFISEIEAKGMNYDNVLDEITGSLSRKSPSNMNALASFGGVIGLSAVMGGVGGAITGAAGMDTSFGGGFAEGAGITSMLIGIGGISAARAGGKSTSMMKNIGVGKVAAVAGGVYGGWSEWEKKDSTFADVMLKGAVYSKIGMSGAMLGMERYGSSIAKMLPKKMAQQ